MAAATKCPHAENLRNLRNLRISLRVIPANPRKPSCESRAALDVTARPRYE